MSKVAAYYHIVFCTKGREMTIPLVMCEDLYRFIWKEITSMRCKLIRIGGIQNHVHLLINLHPSISLSELIRAIKAHSSGWMSTDGRFPDFKGWAAEYYACTLNPQDKDGLIEYIKRQKEHHLKTRFDEELQSIYANAGLTYNDLDLR